MPANYVLLSRTQVTSATSTITFSNIPQTGYTDLKFVMSLRATTSSGVDSFDLLVNFNGSSANKSTVSIRGDGSGVNTNTIGDRLLRLVDPSDYTSNVFSNVEFYIPNYTSGTVKPFLVDGVLENNATGSAQILFGALWNVASAITSMSFTPNGSGAAFEVGSSISLYGIANVGTTPVIAPKASGGDIVVNDGTYWYHAFLSSGIFTPNQTLSCDVLEVAGGGAGGWDWAAGGGAGGIFYKGGNSLTASNYVCTVGAGGAGVVGGQGGNGNNSQFTGTGISLTAAIGGGGGGVGLTSAGSAGGSGGGGGYGNSPVRAGGASTQTGTGGTGYGNAGGSGAGTSASEGSGGGGGAGAAGANAGVSTGGNGGVGTTAFSSWGLATATGENSSGTVYYAGGGGGQGRSTRGTGGLGGGGQNAPSARAAVANTGGGGAGDAGTGGSGIIIVRYTMA